MLCRLKCADCAGRWGPVNKIHMYLYCGERDTKERVDMIGEYGSLQQGGLIAVVARIGGGEVGLGDDPGKVTFGANPCLSPPKSQ